MKNAFGLAKKMFGIYTRQRVPRSAAAMAYYFIISIFPFLIVGYAVLSSLNIPQESLYKIWAQLIPADAADVITNYLQYVGGNRSTFMGIVGVVVTLTSSSAAFRSLLKIMADIQGRPRYTGVWTALYSVAMSLGLLAAVYVSGLVIVSGEWLLSFLERIFGSALFDVWRWERFAVLFLLMLVIILLIYRMTAPREIPKVPRMPGALVPSILIVAVSSVFSNLISASVNYPIIYGSLLRSSY
jgi:membrane protein